MTFADIAPLPLAELTTLGTGGTPTRMIDAHTREDLIDALRAVWTTGEPWFVLGGGSNLFIGDEEIDASVIRVLSQGIERLPDPVPGTARLRVQAGHDWDDLVRTAVEQGLAGIEGLSGIPGTAGATPVQNVGAYGQEVVETLVEVELIDADTGEVSVVPAADLALGLRTSVLKAHYGSVPERLAVILSVTFDLAIVGDEPVAVAHGQLATALGLAPGEKATLRAIRDSVIAIRASKGMVLDPQDPDTRSAGSFFQNPVVSEAFAATLPAAAPRWPMGPGQARAVVLPLAGYDGTLPPLRVDHPDVKVSAAWLIEHAGLKRGYCLPGSRAGLSTKHTLALTNRGGATAEEIAELARLARVRVLAEFGVELTPEPVLIGIEL